MKWSLRNGGAANALIIFFLCLVQIATRTDAALSGSVVMPMGTNLPRIKITFLRQEGDGVGLYIIQSNDLESTDDGFFKVEGPLDCVRYVSDNQVIVSGVAMATAMNHQSFVRVGDAIMLAVTDTKVSIISRVPYNEIGDCLDPDWDDFIMLDVTDGHIDIGLLD